MGQQTSKVESPMAVLADTSAPGWPCGCKVLDQGEGGTCTIHALAYALHKDVLDKWGVHLSLEECLGALKQLDKVEVFEGNFVEEFDGTKLKNMSDRHSGKYGDIIIKVSRSEKTYEGTCVLVYNQTLKDPATKHCVYIKSVQREPMMFFCINSHGNKELHPRIESARMGNLVYRIGAEWVQVTENKTRNSPVILEHVNETSPERPKPILKVPLPAESSNWKRKPDPRFLQYTALRDRVMAVLPEDTDVEGVKEVFRCLLPSRRRLDRITSLSGLIQELEQQLIIFPEKKGISTLGSVLYCVEQLTGHRFPKELLARVETLSQELEPVASAPGAHQGVESARSSGGVPDGVVKKLCRGLERAGGRDWEHLATGLGKNMVQYDVVRIRQGRVDTIEREERGPGSVARILRRVVAEFAEHCSTAGVQEDLVEHIAWLLRSEEVLAEPLPMLARDILAKKV